MIPQTIGREYDVGRVAQVRCIKNDTLKDLDIKGHCFLLIIMREGSANFKVGGRSFKATAPCFVCFDERENPKLTKKQGLKCDSVYFHPMFLNVNMTFKRLRSGDYSRLALSHDMFLLKPFADEERFVFPVFEDYLDNLMALFTRLDTELREQPDWYWSCRSRSCFMEIILMLERAYGVFGQENTPSSLEGITEPHLRRAVIFIESNFEEDITLNSVREAASMNHNTLTQLFKQELGMTPIEYLWHYRIVVAKKHLEFTNLPLKEISLRCGFKTTPHFVRKFGEYVGVTPTEFRKAAVAERKAAFK
ncbi:MAG: helix-turn-helix transcriptional regulator [Clostridia bacterium]|nr:helix-turn-helix transcriptional regulator [Clostridia bacterium]MBR5769707.1 helix-turn-helix transcriptional regulator [Clostridia bacterium]